RFDFSAQWSKTSSSEIFFFCKNKLSCILRKNTLPAFLPCSSAALIANEAIQGKETGFSIHRSPSQLIPVRLAVFSQISLSFLGLSNWSLFNLLKCPVTMGRIVKNRPYSIESFFK